MEWFWQSVQHESCFFMSLECDFEISAHLVKYNSIYGTFSTSTPVCPVYVVAIISCEKRMILEKCST